MIEKLIENFDFTEKEAKVYLAALELGRSKVSEIAIKAKLNRITAYEILKRLKQRGIATSNFYRNTMGFRVIDPDKLLEIRRRQLSLGKELLPQLVLLKKGFKGKPRIEYYDGIEGIKSIYEDTFFCKEKAIYNIVYAENLIKLLGEEFFNNYVKKRISKKISVKVLLPKIEKDKKYVAGSKSKLREVKFFNQEKYNIPNEIMLYDNKVVLLSFLNKIGVVVEDKEIAESMKTIWNFLWDNSKK